MNILSDFFDGHSIVPDIDLLVTLSNMRMNADLFEVIFKWVIIHFFSAFISSTSRRKQKWIYMAILVKKYIEYRIYRGIRIK